MTGKYYVALLYDGEYDLITRVDWKSKEWYSDKGEKALELSQKEARELMRALAIHGVLAAVLEVASWYTLVN